MLSWQAKVHAGHLNDNELGKCPWLKHEGKGPGKVLRVRVRVRARVRVRVRGKVRVTVTVTVRVRVTVRCWVRCVMDGLNRSVSHTCI